MNEREKKEWMELEERKVIALERMENSLSVIVGILGYTWNTIKDIILGLEKN